MLRRAYRLAVLRSFARARSGATAIEFAIIAIPLLVLIFGIIELGMVLLVSTTLESATDFAARDIRTGVFQTGSATSVTDFQKKVCRNMNWLNDGSCLSRLSVQAETFGTFTNTNSGPADPATYDPTKPRCWSVGKPGDIVLVRTYYDWPLFTPLLNAALQNRNTSGPSRLLSSAKAFRNEPYSTDDPVGAKC